MMELTDVGGATLQSLVNKAIPERMDGAESALAAFKLEMDREIKGLKARLESRYKEPTAEEAAKEEAEDRRYRERLAWIQFYAGAIAGACEHSGKMADDMLDEYRKRWEADDE